MIDLFRLSLIFALLTSPVFAVEPDEILSDPVLEDRARNLSQGLRCLVCQNESIDESNAPLAKDLRLLVRERLIAGDSDQQAIEFIVDRYGEFVLLQPTLTGANYILWLAGPAMAVIALGGGLLYLRRRSTATENSAIPLSDAEKERLEKILNG